MSDKDGSQSGATSVSFGGETLKAVAAKFTMALSGFVGTIVFARVLGPTSFGGFYLLLSLIQMTDRPFKGLERAVLKRFAQDDTDDGEILGVVVLAAILWTTVVLIGGWIFRSWLGDYTGIDGAVLPFSILVIGLLGTTPLGLIQAKGRIGASEWWDAVRSYLTFPLQLAFVLLGFGAAGMAYGLAGATAIVAPAGVYYLKAIPTVPSRRTLSSIWSFAKYSIPTAFVGKAYDRFDVLLLGFLVTPAAVANYEVAAKLTLPATFVASAAASLLMPRVSQLDSRGEEVVDDISRTLSFGSILSIPILFGAIAMPQGLVVTVFGGEYAGAGALLIAIAIYRVLGTQTEPLLQSLDGIERPDVTYKLSTVALAVNIPLGVYLVMEIGPVGVVLATIVAESIRYVGAGYVLVNEVDDLSLVSESLLKQLFAGAVMFVVVEAMSRVIGVTSWLTLVVIVGAGACVYGLLLLSISEELRVTIVGIFEGSTYDSLVERLVGLFEFSRS